MKKVLSAFVLSALLSVPAIPAFTVRADACTNSYDRASDGSSCGGRASGCRSGGKGGYC